jgi:hypothetical protein
MNINFNQFVIIVHWKTISQFSNKLIKKKNNNFKCFNQKKNLNQKMWVFYQVSNPVDCREASFNQNTKYLIQIFKTPKSYQRKIFKKYSNIPDPKLKNEQYFNIPTYFAIHFS